MKFKQYNNLILNHKLIFEWNISELNKALKDVASMKAQAENLSSEYDRLCDEKNALERKLAIQGDGDKKDD